MKLYLRYFSIHLRSQMQYKSSFLMVLAGQFFGAFASFLTVWFLMDRFKVVDHFTVSQILLCFAVITMAFSLAECFFRGFDRFSTMIGNGGFDRMLVRPRGLVFQVAASQIELSRLGKLLQAVFVLIYAIPNCGVVWTGEKIFLLILMIVCGMFVFSGLFVIGAGFCFFTTQGLEVLNIFTDGGKQFGQYPFSIYGEGILRFFTYVIPLALFQYYPFLYLVGESSNRLYMLFPLLSLLFLIPCFLFWRFGMRHYKSTGS